ncbi:MAG: type VI secretion system baseplate subunit TssE [Candidatus Thiothrix putei]|uniref:Type VI secretion system baseplate subunit TssE n=1 Tax=Candidatus Thiothrix putei TaxID=3080811 RepID=A0AA95HBM8_9GAMM|nr:MAG: type VI secretion system baseplate subunit TssE [Candidatus Thiothrix putei]
MPTETYLPSLLDRLADDAHVNHSMENCQREVTRLEKQLLNQSDNGDPAQRQQWLKALQDNRTHLAFLQKALGSLQGIRDCVRRDVGWLLNTRNLCIDDLETQYPEIAASVLNYGLPDLTGKTASSLQAGKLEKMLEKAISVFEPRILRQSLQVKLLTNESMQDHNALVFEITGWLWAEPSPLRLQLTTHLDLENGDMKILE